MTVLNKGDHCCLNFQCYLSVKTDCQIVITDDDVESIKCLIRTYIDKNCRKEFKFDETQENG